LTEINRIKGQVYDYVMKHPGQIRRSAEMPLFNRLEEVPA